MIAKGIRPPTRRTPQVNPRPDTQEKIIRRQIARIVERAIGFVAVGKGLPRQRPDAAQENAPPVVLDVEAIQPLAPRGRGLPLFFPKTAQMEEMLKRIAGLADALAKALRQPVGSKTARRSRNELSCFSARSGTSSRPKGSASKRKPNCAKNSSVCSVCRWSSSRKALPSIGSSKRNAKSKSEHGVTSARPVPPSAPTANGLV